MAWYKEEKGHAGQAPCTQEHGGSGASRHSALNDASAGGGTSHRIADVSQTPREMGGGAYLGKGGHEEPAEHDLLPQRRANRHDDEVGPRGDGIARQQRLPQPLRPRVALLGENAGANGSKGLDKGERRDADEDVREPGSAGGEGGRWRGKGAQGSGVRTWMGVLRAWMGVLRTWMGVLRTWVVRRGCKRECQVWRVERRRERGITPSCKGGGLTGV